MARDTKTLTAHVPIDLAHEIDRYAAQQERSRAWVIKQALREWVEREKARERMTRDGLESVAAGRTITHVDVLAWARSLGSDDQGLPRPSSGADR